MSDLPAPAHHDRPTACVHGPDCRQLSCMYCACGDDDCWQMAFGYPWCSKCREHHRQPVGQACFLTDPNSDIGTPEAPTWHCWRCKWKGDHSGAIEHERAEPTHKITRTHDTEHGHGPTDD